MGPRLIQVPRQFVLRRQELKPTPGSLSLCANQRGLTPLIARLATHFPQDRFAQYTAAHDVVQTNFFAQQGGGPAGSNAWTEKMLRELETRQSQTNFRSYVAEGSVHTILRSHLVYTQNSGGMPFVEWLEKFLSDQPLPDNMMCKACLTPTKK